MSQPNQMVLASGNAGKLKEFQLAFASLPNTQFQLVSQSHWQVPEVAETGLTFIENALIKARHAAQHTGLPTLADDSGLVVPALGGQPGIYSARYAGAQALDGENNQKLLHNLAAVSGSDSAEARKAYFYCVLVLMRHAEDPTPIVAEGRWHGTISSSPAGSGGFGYDPIFYLPELKQSAAELTLEQKLNLSHRGKALQKLLALLGKETFATQAL